MLKLPNEVMGRIITDAAFRKDLLNDPEGTLRAANVEATPEVIEALKGLDHSAVDAYLSGAGRAVGKDAAV